jgi:hypothetical protein
MSKFQKELKKFQETLTDVAKMSSREFSRGVDLAKKQLERVQLVQRRKELFAELGRELYDAHRSGLPDHVVSYFKETEFQEIISEIENLDLELQQK